MGGSPPNVSGIDSDSSTFGTISGKGTARWAVRTRGSVEERAAYTLGAWCLITGACGTGVSALW